MKTQCSNCKARYNVAEQLVGKKAKCPKCGQPFIIEPFVEAPVEAVAKSPEMVKSPATTAVNTPKVTEPAKVTETPVKEKQQSKKLSKTLYAYCWAAVQIIAGIFAILGLMLALRKVASPTLIAVFAAGNVFLLGSAAIQLLLFYKMWGAIADSETSTTPGKAVGFLFIPVFNLYWALCMVTGFAEDYNAFVERYSIKTKDLPLMLFLAYAFAFMLYITVVIAPFICILARVSLINRAFIAYHTLSWVLFFLAAAAGAAHFILYILFATRTCDAVNALFGTSEAKN